MYSKIIHIWNQNHFPHGTMNCLSSVSEIMHRGTLQVELNCTALWSAVKGATTGLWETCLYFPHSEVFLTFFGVLQPFNEFLHLGQEDGLALGGVSVLVPLQDHVLTHHILCKGKGQGQSQWHPYPCTGINKLMSQCKTAVSMINTGLILSSRRANERCCYKVTPSLIGWAQT